MEREKPFYTFTHGESTFAFRRPDIAQVDRFTSRMAPGALERRPGLHPRARPGPGGLGPRHRGEARPRPHRRQRHPGGPGFPGRLAELERDPPPLAQLSALIRHWLHREPPEDPEDFLELARQALWLERRYLRQTPR